MVFFKRPQRQMRGEIARFLSSDLGAIIVGDHGQKRSLFDLWNSHRNGRFLRGIRL
jgi:hypothetical protein